MPKQPKNFIPGNHQKVQEAFMQCMNNKNKKNIYKDSKSVTN